MADHTRLNDVTHVGDSLLSDTLECNVLSFFQWGFLGAGGFFNITIPTSGAYGGSEHRLRLVEDPNYTPGQVWEGFRKDWVWETGVECPDGQPIRVSGVYINGGFLPLASGVTVDYPNGRVTLGSAVSTTSVVAAEYSCRLFQLYTADAPWWQQLQTNSFRVDDPQFLQQGSGAWDTMAPNRIQLPAVVVDAVPNVSTAGGYEIGQIRHIRRQDVLFHVLAEDRWYFKWLHDAITYQEEKRLQAFDKNLMFASDAFPLQPDGSPKASGLMYPDLVKPSGEGGFYWNQLRIYRMRSQEQPRIGSIHYCTIRGTFETEVG